MVRASFIVGIDLGTTHCAMASVDWATGAAAPVLDFPIVQLLRPGEVAAQALLPSCVYLPARGEFAAEALRLPWTARSPEPVGEFARWQGARVPGRLVSSAKSWLCHAGVDRQAAILPWGAPEDVSKLSPVDASTRLLSHLAQAWDAAHPDAPLANQEAVITVPASFDQAARALTVNAIRAAGFLRFTLLEEPLAAFYDYTSRHRNDLATDLRAVRLVLVVDVGGGTTDFSLIQVEVLPEGPALRRIAVGDHLMLGGDNMDAALAHQLESGLAGKKLQAGQWTQLVQAARSAKETLLQAASPQYHRVAVGGTTGRLMGGTFSAELAQKTARQVVLDGFFPQVSWDEPIQQSRRMAIQELGLPFAQDPAITRHLAAFLRRHAAAATAALGGVPSELARPDALLLNGGVFNSPVIAQRLIEVVSGFWPDNPVIPCLTHGSLELAVARGAAYSGLARRGLGVKIGGGAARAYYVGLSTHSEAGNTPAICLIPRGFEEGKVVQLDRSFRLSLGRPVQFQLYSTTSDRVDVPGQLVDASTQEFERLPPTHTLLRSRQPNAAEVPVQLQAGMTEIGTLELSCVQTERDERWRLEFDLRGALSKTSLEVTESMPASFGPAVELVQRVYGNKPLPLGPKDVKQLFRNLEHLLGPKESWRVPVLRELWGALFAGRTKRRRSSDHERLFFQFLGFSLRPGFGYPLDGWRCGESFQLFDEGVTFHSEKAVWIEFWVAWRRMAPGLPEREQEHIWQYLRPHLEKKVSPKASQAPSKSKGVTPEGLDEMVRTAASLEHLPLAAKIELGGWIIHRFQEVNSAGGPWAWALGRLGARAPLYGSAHRAISSEFAEQWLRELLKPAALKIDGAAFAVAQLARLTGDRTRDVDSQIRQETLAALQALKVPETWIAMVREVVSLQAADEARALGDTLPAGLLLE